MTDYWPLHWQFQKERSFEDNMEALAQGLCMLSRTLSSFEDVAFDDKEITIHPSVLRLLSEMALSMANEAMKMVDYSLSTRRARKQNQGPGKLVPFDRSSLKTEDEGEEESDVEE